MRGIQMKKLILVPTILATAFLALAFAAPGTARGMAQSVVPVLHAALPAAFTAEGSANVGRSASSSGVSSQGSQGNIRTLGSSQVSTGTDGSSTASSSIDESSDAQGHALATAAQENCGRFGNGFHGGKHNFVCPNRPFPAPAS